MAKFDLKEMAILDKQIETIMTCTPLPEAEVKLLAEKVRKAPSLHSAFINARGLVCRQKKS